MVNITIVPSISVSPINSIEHKTETEAIPGHYQGVHIVEVEPAVALVLINLHRAITAAVAATSVADYD